MVYIIVTTILLILAVVIIGLLVVPFKISMHLSNKGSLIQGDIQITWMRIRFFHRKIPSEKEKEEIKEEKKKKGKKEKKFDFKRIPKIIHLLMESWPYLTRILNEFFKSLSVEKFSIDFIIGLSSPVDTAVISGYIWSLASIVNIIPNAHLSVTPDFQKVRIDGSIILKLKFKLFWVVVAFIKAFTKKPVRMLLGEIRRN
ncbi:MAG: DUF2953 domain-containing protein [Euryarchaeota archaeon]|nr:DUF2953 domain-containing protein [Euryarchaeota archaeon]